MPELDFDFREDPVTYDALIKNYTSMREVIPGQIIRIGREVIKVIGFLTSQHPNEAWESKELIFALPPNLPPALALDGYSRWTQSCSRAFIVGQVVDLWSQNQPILSSTQKKYHIYNFFKFKPKETIEELCACLFRLQLRRERRWLGTYERRILSCSREERLIGQLAELRAAIRTNQVEAEQHARILSNIIKLRTLFPVNSVNPAKRQRRRIITANDVLPNADLLF